MSTKLIDIFETASPVAFVTGSAADRVGRRIAELLLANGFKVAFHSHRPNMAASTYIDQLRSRSQEVMLCVGAVQDELCVDQWHSQIMERWQRVDLLVNSAAVWHHRPLEQTTTADLRDDFEVNALGSFLTTQRFGLTMSGQASGGAIIQIGDWAVARPYIDFASYFLSKGSLETMVRAFAVELASRNPRVRVNGVLPGPVMMAPEVTEQAQQRIIEQCLLKRAGTPEDVAEAVWFLAASPFITGVCLPVDGGRSIYAGPGTDPIAHPAGYQP
jgi:pteridine reductase